MRTIFVVALGLLALIACSTGPAAKDAREEKPFFEAALVETFIPGKTTQEEIRKTLGEPYPDPLKTPQRWTYMYTFRRQIVFFFKDGVLVEKTWSEEYGIGTGGR